MNDVEGMAPGRVEAQLPSAAELVKTDRGEGADECEAGRQRKKHRQQVVRERHAKKQQADDRINCTQEDDVRWHCHEILTAFPEDFLEVGNLQRSDDRQVIGSLRRENDIKLRHHLNSSDRVPGS